MPDITFDEFGLPVWTNSASGPDRSGTDPEPIGSALAEEVEISQAALDIMGLEGGIPLPTPMTHGPGTQLVGPPPESTRANALINPEDDSLVYPDPEPFSHLAAPGSGLSGNKPVNALGMEIEEPVPAPTAPVAQGAQAPTAPGVAGTPGAKTGDAVLDAEAAQDQAAVTAAQMEYQKLQADLEVQRAQADRRASAQEDFARQQAESDTKFQAARAQAQADSERETAKWMMDMEEQAKKEPNPKRWFANQSTFGKALWLASLAFGTKAAATAPGVQNVGLAMIKEQLDSDMAEQKARLAREMEVMRTRGQQLDKKQLQRLQNLKDDHSIRAGQLLALEKAALERANAPGSEDDRAAMAAAHAWLAQQRMQTAATRSAQAYQAKEAKLARGHAWAMQSQRQKFERAQAAEQRAWQSAENLIRLKYDYDKLGAEVAARTAATEAAKAGKAANTFTFDPKSSGITVIKDGRAVPLQLDTSSEFRQKKVEYATNLANAAQEVTAELDIIKEAIKDGSFTSRILGSDANLQAAVARLGYSKAKENDPRGIVTNADFTAGLVSAMGVKYDTATGRFMYEAKHAFSKTPGKDKLIESIEREQATVESRTNSKLNTYLGMEEGGGKVSWRAQNRNPLEAQTETLAQAEARVSGASKEDWLPKGNQVELRSVKDLEKAQELANAGAKDALPPYQTIQSERLNHPVGTSTGKIVEDAKSNFTGLSPEKIRTFKQDFVGAVQGDARAMLEIEQAADKALKAAEVAEAAVKVELAASLKKPTAAKVVEQLKRKGLGAMEQDAQYIEDMMTAVDAMKSNAFKDKK